MRVLCSVLALAFVLTAGPARADCSPPPTFNMLAWVDWVRAISNYYESAPLPGNPDPAQRVRLRNAEIRVQFDRFESERVTAFGAVSCRMTVYKTCTASTGNVRRCPAKMIVPSIERWLPETIEYWGSPGAFKKAPRVVPPGTIIEFTLGKAGGNGQNWGRVTALSKFAPGYPQSAAKGERKKLRDELNRLRLPTDETPDP